MSNYIEKYVYRSTPEGRKVTIKIMHDLDADNPREENDNVGTMVTWHRNYTFGDKPEFGGRVGFPDQDPQHYRQRLVQLADPKLERFARNATPRELHLRVEALLAEHYVMLPVYLYDHGVQHLAVGSFVGRAQHAEWDSAQVGFIYCTKYKAMSEWGDDYRQKATEYLKGEVEEYDQYLSGQVYGYSIKRKGEELESCWGFYGLDYTKKEAEGCADTILEALPPKQEKQA